MIPEIINRMGNLEYNNDGTINGQKYYLNLIEDIKEYMYQIANQKGKKLEIQ